jgi:hypothetical protein
MVVSDWGTEAYFERVFDSFDTDSDDQVSWEEAWSILKHSE